MTDSPAKPKRKLSPPRRVSLTKRYLDSLRPEESDFFVWDVDLPGFGVRVRPSGRRSYEVQYRLANGRQRRRVIGTYPPMPLASARRDAKSWLADAQRGEDRAVKLDRQRQPLTVASLCEQYIERHAVPLKKPNSVREDRRMVDHYVKPRLGSHPAASITREDIERLHKGLKDTPYQANRVLALLSNLFNQFEMQIRDRRPDWRNPCRRVQRFKEEKRRRYLSSAELARLSTVLSTATRDGSVNPTVTAAIRLLLFTGCRLSEILTLQWDQVDFERRCLRLTDSKSGAKDVMLNAPALEILSQLERLPDNPYVVPGKAQGRHMKGLRHGWEPIRARADLEDVRLHDLRHSFASIGTGAGLSLPVLGALLGHATPATTQRYAHLAANPLQEAADLIGRRLQDAMDADPEAQTEVVPLRPKGAR